MKRCIRIGVATLAMTLWSPALWAQWGPHASPRVPRTAAGEPDLEAAAPRTADGKPDLAGVWQGVGGLGANNQPALEFSKGPPVAGFLNVADKIEGGLPFKPEAKALFDARRAANGKDNPEAVCLPMGNLQFHTQGAPRKIVQTPDLLVILYEASMGVRQVFTDGRKLPDDDPQPWWYGYSVGHWDGDTLVVETSGFRDDGWLDIYGTPLTDAAKMTERFRRVNYGVLEIDVTIDDPKAYTKPFTVRVDQRIMVDDEMIEFICAEN